MIANVFIALAVFLAGLICGLLCCRKTITHLRRRVRTLRANTGLAEQEKKKETAKKVVWACLINGFAWVWCSYILAALDKMQIAETLSQVAVTEIIGVVLVYCLKSVIENLSKHNHWPDKTARKDPAGTDEGPGEEREEPEGVGQ